MAAHNQNDTKENVVAYMKSNGLSDDTTNLTVTSRGRHSKVKGNGYVPYYMVFDQHGNLAHHHMCGDYHGGDGLKMIEWVDKLLKESGDIYLGAEPYEHAPKLAKQIASKKSLAAAVKKVETERAAGATGGRLSDLDRLYAALTTYRDGRLEGVARLLATKPDRVLKTLKVLDKEMKGTELGGPVAAKLLEMSKSADLKAAIGVAKTFEKAKKRFEERPTAGNLKKTRTKLEKLVAGHPNLPITKTVQSTSKAFNADRDGD
ncbi:MAG: hypothetical protein V3T86_14605 [Planctomycetota bacterium]